MNTNDSINIIRASVIEKQDVKNIDYRLLDSNDYKNDLQILNKFPLYYMFDLQLNQDIGSSSGDLHNILIGIDAYKLFNVDHTNIVHLPIKEHASILYKIDYDDSNKWYIYYSNSGLGIDNHPTYISSIVQNMMVCPKILSFSSKQLRDDTCSILCDVITKTYEIKSIYDTKKMFITTPDIVNGYIQTIKENKNIFTDISAVLIKIIELNCPAREMQNLFYALMYYLISQNKDNISDISFNELISKEERNEYKQLINKLLTNMNSEKKGFCTILR